MRPRPAPPATATAGTSQVQKVSQAGTAFVAPETCDRSFVSLEMEEPLLSPRFRSEAQD